MLRLLLLYFLVPPSLARSFKRGGSPYCQPGQDCWPTQEEVATFSSSLTASSSDPGDCLGLPTFCSVDQPGDPVLNLWYPEAPEYVTPYQLANLRNHVADGVMAYFVVIARNESDVVEAVKFATSHNLGISVISTGHDFNDRNAGPGPNSLLVRTTCLRTVEFDLDPQNRWGHTDDKISNLVSLFLIQ